MSLPPQVSVWDLWSESARLTESLGDPLFLECMEAAGSNKIFDDLTDDQLKTSLSIINSLLNDHKTKPKGLTLFNDFATQINPSRLIGFQDAVISTLHLVVKALDSPSANTALVNFLPKCHHMSEVNQVVISSILPKILGYFVGEIQDSISQRSSEEIALLKVCLVEYHGPCGHFRDKLEKMLVPLLDSENKELIALLGELMPLLSYAGGGGNAGDKHIKDWTTMLKKFLKTTYSILLHLYGDSCRTLERDNPFDGELLVGLKRISEAQVLLRMSLLKRRLQNLLSIISGYLRSQFPAPKLVPQKGILELILRLIAVIPPTTARNANEKSYRKENVFLAAIVPGIHEMALNLLRNFLQCVGSNIFTSGTTVEQIISNEFKWLLDKPRAFEKLKLELYATLTAWLTLTRGSVTNLKTMNLWTIAIGKDTRVEKDVVELKMSKPKPGKSVKLMSSSSMTLSSGSATQVFVEKNTELCQASLNTLIRLIPALDSENHRKIYEHLVRTASIISQFQCPPSPYDNPECRKFLYQNLSRLCQSPHPKSPVSVALTITLLRNGIQDPTTLVSAFCASQIFELERLLHPKSAPLALAGPAPHPVALDNSFNINYTSCVLPEEADEPPYQHESSSVQAESAEESRTEKPDFIAPSQDIVFNHIKDKMDEILKDAFIKIIQSQVNDKDAQTVQTSAASNSGESGSLASSRKEVSNSQPSRISSSSSTIFMRQQRYDNDVVLLSDNNDESDHSETRESVKVNGNGYHQEDSIEQDDIEEISVDSSKRKADSQVDDEVETTKKHKIISPIKPVPGTPDEHTDGPSVEDMLSSFVDIEAEPGV